MMPEVKMIALLRNPAERAISQYNHNKRQGNEDLPLYEALISEESRLQPSLDREDYTSLAYRHFSYQTRGLYKEQLERYFEHFSRDQLLIFPSEAFFSRPRDVLNQVYKFVGVDTEYEVKDLTPRNVSHRHRDVPLKVQQHLNSFFAPHNEALFEFLGDDYCW